MNILLYAPGAWPIDDALLDPTQHQIERLQGGLTELVKATSTRQPDLILLTGYESSAEFLQEIEGLCVALPNATIGVFQPQASPDQLVEMMRAGVRDVLTDCRQETVHQVLERAMARQKNLQPIRSRVLGVITSKGGDGGSCVTANFAHALAHIDQRRRASTRVLVIDLSLPFGDLEMYLANQTGMKDLVDVSAEADRLDRSLLDSMVHHATPKLDLIVSPSSFEKVVRVQPEQIRRLVNIARRHYNYVVLDLGSSLDQVSLSVLDQLDGIFLVGSAILPSIRRSSQILKLLTALDIPDSAVSVIINRFDTQGSISRQEMENVIGKTIRTFLPPEHAGIANSLLRGKTVMELLPESKFAQAINEWASQITGVPIRKKSLWQRLRKK